MKQDRISGIAIIVGSLMGVATMALHPVGGHLRTDIEYLSRIASVAFAVHALGLASIAVQAFGFLGFHRALGSGDARAQAGLVAFVVAWIAVFGAALAGGILTSEMIRHYPGLDASEQTAMHAIWDYNFMVNQALDKAVIKVLQQRGVLTRQAMRQQLAVNNQRLGQTLATLQQGGQIERGPAGWILRDGQR